MTRQKNIFVLLIFLLSFAWCNQILLAQSKFLKHFSLTQSSASLPPSNSVSHITIQDSIIWIGTSNGVGRSLNIGRSWESFRSNPAFANDGIFAITADKDRIWVATGYDKEINESSVQTGSGYTFSMDSGQTWQHLPQTIDQPGDSIISYGINDSLWLLPVIVPEQNVTFDISLSPGTVWIASWASGLRKSTDNGQTWQRIILPPDNRSSIKPTDTLWSYASNDPLKQHRIFQHNNVVDNFNMGAFSVYAANNNEIWCGTAGGINRSTDGGLSWDRFNHQNQEKPILGNWVIDIEEQNFKGQRRIWTTNWRTNDPSEDYGVSYTNDTGRTWINLLQGVRAYDFAFKDSITAYIATDEGLYRTDDGGLNFSKITVITNQATRQIVSPVRALAVGVIGDTVILATSDGMASTVDDGSSQFGSSWTIYRTYQELGTSTTSYAYPNPFSPSLELLRIHYGKKDLLAASPRTVNIDIFDFGMTRVRTVIHGVIRSTNAEYDELWDGKNDEGRIVANGVYFYRIKIDSDEPMFGKILVLQ